VISGPQVSGRPARAVVDLSAVAANAQLVKSLIGPNCCLASVVKANGYGLGAVPVALAALQGGASFLAVATVDEGVELRLAGIEAPILVMSYSPPGESQAAVRHGLTLALNGVETAAALDAAAAELGAAPGSVAVHLKVDTGLGRYGCQPQGVVAIATAIIAYPHLRLEGLMTHFAEADSADHSFTFQQLEVFRTAQHQTSEAGIAFDILHAANSAATISLPESRFDMVRVGLVLYGLLPSEHLRDRVEPHPVLSVKSKLVRVFPVGPGDTVGYGRTWTAQGHGRIGLVPVGYADGYRRALSNRAQVLVAGKRFSVAGRVSMDQIAVDLRNSHEAREGDEVVLIGKQGNDEITATELAEWADTISYEILTGLGGRLPRIYIWDGNVVGHRDLLSSSLSLPMLEELGSK
jgi:alanine racemase